MATVYDGYEDLFLENRLECEIIAWKHITNPAINLHAIKPRTSVNVLVILVKILANLPVKLTESGQGGPSGPGLQGSTQGGHVPRCVAPRQLIWGLAQGPSPVLEPILRPIGHAYS